jgi:hypothetical protein
LNRRLACESRLRVRSRKKRWPSGHPPKRGHPPLRGREDTGPLHGLPMATWRFPRRAPGPSGDSDGASPSPSQAQAQAATGSDSRGIAALACIDELLVRALQASSRCQCALVRACCGFRGSSFRVFSRGQRQRPRGLSSGVTRSLSRPEDESFFLRVGKQSQRSKSRLPRRVQGVFKSEALNVNQPAPGCMPTSELREWQPGLRGASVPWSARTVPLASAKAGTHQ